MSNAPLSSSTPITPAQAHTGVRVGGHRRQLQTIQAARGVAALTVVAFHLTMFVSESYAKTALWVSLFERGFAGVDLFFVISGFVIVYTSQDYINRPGQLRIYLTKRFVRVYPMYWLSVLGMMALMAASYVAGGPSVRNSINSQWPDLTTFLLTPYHKILNGVSWSLSYELFFYLLFACLIISRRLWLIPSLFLLGSFYVTFTQSYFVPGETSVISYFWFSPLNVEFALGAIVGVWFTRRPPTLWLGTLLGTLGLVWLFALPDTLNEYLSLRLGHYGIASFLLLTGLLTLEHTFTLKLPRWMVLTGDASYVIYLVHLPAMLFFSRLIIRLFPTYTPTVSLLCLSFVVGITLLSIGIHRWVEKPLMRTLTARLLPKTRPS